MISSCWQIRHTENLSETYNLHHNCEASMNGDSVIPTMKYMPVLYMYMQLCSGKRVTAQLTSTLCAQQCLLCTLLKYVFTNRLRFHPISPCCAMFCSSLLPTYCDQQMPLKSSLLLNDNRLYPVMTELQKAMCGTHP